MLCNYGCGREAKFQFKNGKWCCEKMWQRCPVYRRKVSEQCKGRPSPIKGKKRPVSVVKKMSVSMIKYWSNNENREKQSERIKKVCKKDKVKKRKAVAAKKQWAIKGFKDKMSVIHKTSWEKNYDKMVNKSFRRTIKYLKFKYTTFSKVEDMRYNPGQIDEKEIQVRCKNHNCVNSKEKDGWFTPTGRQIECRITSLERPDGNESSYFYCSEKCKEECRLFGKRVSQLIKEDEIVLDIEGPLYSSEEYNIYRQEVLRRANYKCEYCDKPATYVHHGKPQKLEPFFALDPDWGVACCRKCHYKYGHKTGTKCSTGNLASIICTGFYKRKE